MLSVVNGQVVGPGASPLRLRGINLGGWLMMEGYILGGRNIPEHVFKLRLEKIFGPAFVGDFTRKFRDSFITVGDIRNIKALGFNCVRLPFNYRLLEEPGGLKYLQGLVRIFANNKLFVILDMHAVPGSQNQDWHSDSTGRALFWKDEKYRKKYLALWKLLAATFKDEVWIAGYDIMNEPVTEDVGLLKEIYQRVIDSIGSTGDKHLLFLEGNKWGREVDFIKGLKGSNLVLSVHFYEPADFTFDWLPGSTYPGKIKEKLWNKNTLKKKLAAYAKLGLPVFLGEFGVASRCPACGHEFCWVKDLLEVVEQLGFHWTYWTYKSVRGMNFPDGLYQLSDRRDIVGVRPLVSGMDNYYGILKERQEEFFALWRTDNFTRNPFLFSIIRKFLL
jgi:endoglucanase